MPPTRDPPQNKRPTHLQVKGWEKIFQANGKEKKADVSDKIDFKTKAIKKRHRKTLCNTQWKNPSRSHEYCKHICTQHRSTQLCKENLGGLLKRY